MVDITINGWANQLLETNSSRLKRDLNRDDFDLDDYSNPLVPDMVRTISNWAQATDQTLKGIADKETRSATEKEITKQLLTVMK